MKTRLSTVKQDAEFTYKNRRYNVVKKTETVITTCRQADKHEGTYLLPLHPSTIVLTRKQNIEL